MTYRESRAAFGAVAIEMAMHNWRLRKAIAPDPVRFIGWYRRYENSAQQRTR